MSAVPMRPSERRVASSIAKVDAAVKARVRQEKVAAPPVVRLVRGDEVPIEPLTWLWHHFLPAGALTILGGAPGCGKTTIALSVAATITRGGRWPDGTRCTEAGDALIWSGEDAHSGLAARLVASGADMTRVHLIAGVGTDAFDPGSDMTLLADRAGELDAPRLLILDPIVSAVTGDSHKATEVRRSLQPVVDLAHGLGCAVLGITHFSKGTAGRDPVERITGSGAFGALPRMVWVAAKVMPGPGEEGEPRRVLMRAKANDAPDGGGFAYELERVPVKTGVEGQRVCWVGPLEGSARDLLASAEAKPDDDDGNADAGSFLRGLLTDGPIGAKVALAEASAAGFSRDQMQRAARRLRVDRRKDGMHGGWVWALPAREGGAEGGEDRTFQSAPPSPPSAPSSAQSGTAAIGAETPAGRLADDAEAF